MRKGDWRYVDYESALADENAQLRARIKEHVSEMESAKEREGLFRNLYVYEIRQLEEDLRLKDRMIGRLKAANERLAARLPEAREDENE